MVDFEAEKYENIVDFSARLDDRLAQAPPLLRDASADRTAFGGRPYDRFEARSRSDRAPTLFDFRPHVLSGRDKRILQVFGFSMTLAGLLMGIAFGLTTATVQVLQFLD